MSAHDDDRPHTADEHTADARGDAATSELPSDPARRRTLGVLVAAGSAAYACALVVPASRFLESPTGPGGARWLRVAQAAGLEDGKPVRVQVRGELRDAFTVTPDVTLGSLWLTKRGGEFLALSAECPHLGCAVNLASNGAVFGCPCHTSRFALDGRAESGPSPRGMDPLATRVVDGWIEVEFRRYRQGSAARIEVGS